MANQYAHTIIPWLMGGLGSLILLAAGQTIRFWRESKRSPYYFLRRQAEQNMQSYSLATLGLMATTLFVGMYVFQGAGDHVSRVTMMTNAKPAPTTAVASNSRTLSPPPPLQLTEADEPEVVIVRALPFADPIPSLLQGSSDEVEMAAGVSETAVAPTTRLATPVLPAEYNTYEPVAQLKDNTTLDSIAFTTQVDKQLKPIAARQMFTEGRFKLYATFQYDGMEDGMVWSWVWRHEGNAINGGNEMWAYGTDGPGYVYLNPPTGFMPGNYTVEIWVNGTLQAQGNFFITADVAAGN